MLVDIHSLGVFSRLAKQGSKQAAGSLSRMTGVDVHVDVTNISLLSRRDLSDAFGDEEYVGVEIGFVGGLQGETVLAFERDSSARLLELLMPGHGGATDPAMARSGVKEVGNIMTSGFIDGWANHLGVSIDITPPTYIERSGSELLDVQASEADDQVFLFESRLTTPERDLDFHIYMSPEYSALTELMAAHRRDDDAIPVDKLSVFNEMMKRGAEGAATHVTSMTGIETTVDVSRLSFVPIADAPDYLDDGSHAGVVFGIEGLPSGYLLILFDEPSAVNVAEALLPMETEESGLGELERSAIKELGNIMTSGFIDGWANVLGTSIDHTPPQFVHDMGSAIMSPVIARLGQRQNYAFMIDSTIETAENRFSCDIYALPDERELVRALEALGPESGTRVGTDADEVV
ncbi:chemotaxis protein CheC [Halobium salinum]|uniref:Chemotaxis protein CheC n=1 Tax=Halobium salinum TaxID=1364940 RepID=A0ABD5PHA7_9EURY|nr:chemotaxis protein CheC [Halobium salinum]